jgi:hypothetical protein
MRKPYGRIVAAAKQPSTSSMLTGTNKLSMPPSITGTVGAVSIRLTASGFSQSPEAHNA